jgi:hypothetical protein
MQLALWVAGNDTGVLEVYQMLFLHRAQVIQHFISRMPAFERDTDEITHCTLHP